MVLNVIAIGSTLARSDDMKLAQKTLLCVLFLAFSFAVHHSMLKVRNPKKQDWPISYILVHYSKINMP